MQLNFLFTLKNTRTVFIQLMTMAILLLNTLAIVYVATQVRVALWIIVVASFGSLILIIAKFFTPKYWMIIFIASILICIAWLALGYWLIGIAVILLTAFAKEAAKNKHIIFTEKNVATKTLFGKTYEWQALQNVVLKDGLLTIDFKNNQLLQVLIEPQINTTEELNFNDFCKKCLLRGW